MRVERIGATLGGLCFFARYDRPNMIPRHRHGMMYTSVLEVERIIMYVKSFFAKCRSSCFFCCCLCRAQGHRALKSTSGHCSRCIAVSSFRFPSTRFPAYVFPSSEIRTLYTTITNRWFNRPDGRGFVSFIHEEKPKSEHLQLHGAPAQRSSGRVAERVYR